jgi:2-C-methyl-D-erythritol 4-phosphate cytidylyltransferase
MSVSVIIPAAGLGTRMKTNELKPYILFQDVPIILHTLRVFERHPRVDEIIVVVHQEEIKRTEEMVYGLEKVKKVVVGGEERQESVFRGLKHATKEWVLVHDAVRPFVTKEEISRLLHEVQAHHAVTLAVPVKNTVKIIKEDGEIEKTLDRSLLREILTPQAFLTDLLLKAHLAYPTPPFIATDDAMLVERLGLPVWVVEGNYTNIKITTPEDLVFAKAIYERMGELV